MEKQINAATETNGGVGEEAAVGNIELAEDGEFNG